MMPSGKGFAKELLLLAALQRHGSQPVPLGELGVQALPGSTLRKAIVYTDGMRDEGLLRFLDEPAIPIDNGEPSCVRYSACESHQTRPADFDCRW